MKNRPGSLSSMSLAGLLAACVGLHPTGGSAAAIPPESNYPPRPAMLVPIAPAEPGRRAVDNVLQDLGPKAVNQLRPYFERAGVAYPPGAVTLVALKAEKKLELWARGDGEFRFIRDYRVLAASGTAGPKLRQGDRQVPEGIYRIARLNPNSRFHLSMKLNYPNEFDLFHAVLEERDDPGSDIFIHGKNVSIGCLAIGDAAIEELFVLVAQAGKENVKVVIAPRDPRRKPLATGSRGMPPWTGDLYAMIEHEIQVLAGPLKVSGNAPGIQRLAGTRR